MDGPAGYKTAVGEVLPRVVTVMDPFHVVQLAGQKLTQCRQRLQQETLGRRGRSGDPLYRIRRPLLSRPAYLSETNWAKVMEALENPDYTALARLWQVYQSFIQAFENPNKQKARSRLGAIIDALTPEVTRGQPELRALARTLRRRRNDILAHFTHPYSSNGPTEAINGRLEHLRGIALGFTNLGNYITRSLLHSGGFKHQLQPQL